MAQWGVFVQVLILGYLDLLRMYVCTYVKLVAGRYVVIGKYLVA